jgi:hypothetical protein
MFIAFSQINILGVLAVTVVNFILGGIYFGVVIAKQYQIAMGRENEPSQKPSALMMGGPVVCGLIMTLANALLIRSLNIQAVPEALIFGAITGVGYLIPMTMMVAINPNFPRPFFYTAINAPYFLVSNLIGCAILVAIG